MAVRVGDMADDPPQVDRRANRAIVRYYIITIFLVILTVTYSVASYITTTVSTTVITDVIQVCSYEKQIPCSPSLLNYVDKSKADGLRSDFENRAKFSQEPDWDKIKINDPINLNLAFQNIFYNLTIINFFTGHTLPSCLAYYEDGSCVGSGDPKGAFVTLFWPIEKLLSESHIVYDVYSTYLLPLLYALLGAAVYNLRNFVTDGERISKGSVVRADIRMLLALVAGAIMGFFEQGKLFQAVESSASGLPQQAIAFLAGYGAEILYSAFDGIVDVFKKMRPT